MSRTALYAPVETRPVYTKKSETLLKLFPASPSTSYTTGNVTCNYIKKPATVQWAYQIVFDEPLYDAPNSVDFELEPSEETELVIKILELSGLLIKDFNMYNAVNQEEVETIQQEKS